MPAIDRNSTTPYYMQLYSQVAKGIESEIYPAGKKLPSIRDCARELGVSNTTVELAYQKLVEEGYVSAKRGSGYTICTVGKASTSGLERFTDECREEFLKLSENEKQRESETDPEYDFAYDSVDETLFPFNLWARISRDVFFAKGAQEACLYNDRQGLKGLRTQIATFLNGEMGIYCSQEQVLVMPTTRDLISEIIALFEPDEAVMSMEEPGFDEVSSLLLDRGHEVRLIPMYPSPAWNEVEQLLDGVNVVFATPSTQFPTNHVMSYDMRKRIVAWAQDNNAYIIDDEYGWEFLTGMSRIPSLGVIDNSGHVITTGTFSNSFSPAVSLSYAVLPPQLMLKWRNKRRGAHPKVPWQTQAAMAAFMEGGYWRTHIRKTRMAMQKKRAVLMKSLENHMGANIEVVKGPNSLYVLVNVKDGRTEAELIKAAEDGGVRVYPTSRYWAGELPDDGCCILVGYAGIPIEKIDEGIEQLAKTWDF